MDQSVFTYIGTYINTEVLYLELIYTRLSFCYLHIQIRTNALKIDSFLNFQFAHFYIQNIF